MAPDATEHFRGRIEAHFHLRWSESGLKKGERHSRGEHRWPIVDGSIRFAGIRPKTLPLDPSYDIASAPPTAKVSGTLDPRRPAGRRRVLGPLSMLGQGSLANDTGWPRLPLHQARTTTWSSEVPGLIEFDYRCRSFIAAHFDNIDLFEKEKN